MHVKNEVIPPASGSRPVRRSGAFKETLIRALLLAAASASILIVALIFIFIGREAFPFIKAPGLGELARRVWAPVSFHKSEFGLAPLVAGSLVVTVLATLFAVPFGVVGAVYLSEVASRAEREFLKPFIELIAGIPSVVIGFFGLIVLAPIVKRAFWLDSGLTALTGALILAVMAVPTIMTISEDALRAVPESYKQASLALGAGNMQTVWRVTVPAALSGIIAATMLGVGRVAGETMAVLMVTGNAALVTLSPLESVRTMTATIAGEMGEVAFGSAHYRALFWVGLVLLLFTFVINIIAQRVLRKYRMHG